MSAPRIASAANVVAEPRDLFETRLPGHLRGHCPHVFPHPDGGEGWSWASERPEPVFGWDFPGAPRWTFAELPAACTDPVAHLAAMDEARVDAAVVFPLSLLEGSRRLGPEMQRACISVYDDWISETFEAVDPDRILAPWLLPDLGGPWATARELERALAAGARAVLLPALPPAATAEHEAIWAELAAADLTVCVAVPATGGAGTADLAQQVAVLLDAHPMLRIVTAPVDVHGSLLNTEWELPRARLFDAVHPRGASMYCADLPRRLVAVPEDHDVAGGHALRAFRFERRPVDAAQSLVRLRTEVPSPRTDTGGPGLHTLPALGIALSNIVDRGPLTARALAASAQRIEEMGFHGIWVGDAVARRPGTRSADPFTALGIAAAVTDEVELGTAIFQVPLRRRVEVANRALSLHELVPGRFLFGVGAGSTQADFDASGLSFDGRFRELREALPEMKALWRGERVGAAALYPSPAALGGPPVLIGSWGGRWVERAAEDYEGWIASGTRTWRALGEAVTRYKAAGGHRAVLSTVFANLSVEGAPIDDDDRVHLACSPSDAVVRLQHIAALGFTDVVIFNLGPVEPLAELARLVTQSDGEHHAGAERGTRP